jgi:hypothetical protein
MRAQIDPPGRAIAYGIGEYFAGEALAIFESKSSRDATFESRDGCARINRIQISICDSPDPRSGEISIAVI